MQLNEKQKEAIKTIHGPLLVVAGAGSGKTTVVIERIIEMLESGVKPEEILAIAFTNKATNEMRERISRKLGESYLDKMWISTFHKLCIEILRTEADFVSYINSNFKIASTFEIRQALKNIIDKIELPEQADKDFFKPVTIASAIALLKNEMVTDKMLLEKKLEEDYLNKDKIKEIILDVIKQNNYGTFVKIYALYQRTLRTKELVDLEDVLLYVTYLFLTNSSILEKYQERFKYISIDEYQDTNRVQYLFFKKLAERYKNICAVGDTSQSIYRFRGADINNILVFKEDFPNAKMIKLEKNYRSTRTILMAANQIISHNKDEIKKELITSKDDGSKIVLHIADFNNDEAEYVAQKIKEQVTSGKRQFKDIAVFYRNNSDSASLERVFKTEEIPFKLSSDGGFFDQAEIIDIIKYLEFLLDPTNVSAFKRIINQPKRGIGTTTINKIIEEANGGNLLDIVENPINIPRINKNTLNGLNEFSQVIRYLLSKKDEAKVSDFIANIINKTNYSSVFEDLEQSLVRRKQRNIKQLVSEAREMEMKNSFTVEQFLKAISQKDIDSEMQESDDWNEVTLSTVHSAKGSEYPVVYVIGLKEQGFPSQYAVTEKDIEEERRLMYVALTRAEEELNLSYSAKRLEKLEDKTTVEKENVPSRFLSEFDSSLMIKQ